MVEIKLEDIPPEALEYFRQQGIKGSKEWYAKQDKETISKMRKKAAKTRLKKKKKKT